MKVSILSMQRVYNYGSFLQAYGLKKMLESLGHQVKFIDILPGENQEINGEAETSVFVKIKNMLSSNAVKHIIFKLKTDELGRLFVKWQGEELGVTEEKMFLDSDCEAVIIGSDEVFNCSSSCWWGVSTQLYGDIPCSKVISYAASCGFFTYEDLPEKYRGDVKKALEHQSAISVRDDNTFSFVKKVSGIEASYNLDPVLMYRFDAEVEQTEKHMNLNEDYMIVYAYRNRISDKSEIKAIKDYARKNNLKLYCVGGALSWCDKFPLWTPFEVLAGFKNAACVVTDTFHGTIMAAKYNRPFVSLVRESNANKLNDLLGRLELMEHKWDGKTQINEKMEIIDFSGFNAVVERERKNTEDYLKSNLI